SDAAADSGVVEIGVVGDSFTFSNEIGNTHSLAPLIGAGAINIALEHHHILLLRQNRKVFDQVPVAGGKTRSPERRQVSIQSDAFLVIVNPLDLYTLGITESTTPARQGYDAA